MGQVVGHTQRADCWRHVASERSVDGRSPIDGAMRSESQGGSVATASHDDRREEQASAQGGQACILRRRCAHAKASNTEGCAGCMVGSTMPRPTAHWRLGHLGIQHHRDSLRLTWRLRRQRARRRLLFARGTLVVGVGRLNLVVVRLPSLLGLGARADVKPVHPPDAAWCVVGAGGQPQHRAKAHSLLIGVALCASAAGGDIERTAISMRGLSPSLKSPAAHPGSISSQ